MEIKIIDDVEYYCFMNGRCYPVEMMKRLISDYLNNKVKEQIEFVDHQNSKQ